MIPKISSKKRPSINLSLFINNLSETFSTSSSASSSSDQASKSPNSNKSPKRTFDGGVVGLGIVAAMDEIHDTHDGISSAKTTRVAKMAIPSRSEPIPIVFAKPIVKFRDPILEKYEMGVGELSESYTCVTSHVGNGNSNKKREFFDVSGDRNGGFGGISKSGVFFTSPLKNIEAGSLFGTADFLSCCYLCSKKLQGLDIFMYRGEKAFCSAECRMKHISIDEHRAKCGSGTLKSYAYSVSPCSTPQIFSGVTAA